MYHGTKNKASLSILFDNCKENSLPAKNFGLMRAAFEHLIPATVTVNPQYRGDTSYVTAVSMPFLYHEIGKKQCTFRPKPLNRSFINFKIANKRAAQVFVIGSIANPRKSYSMKNSHSEASNLSSRGVQLQSHRLCQRQPHK